MSSHTAEINLPPQSEEMLQPESVASTQPSASSGTLRTPQSLADEENSRSNITVNRKSFPYTTDTGTPVNDDNLAPKASTANLTSPQKISHTATKNLSLSAAAFREGLSIKTEFPSDIKDNHHPQEIDFPHSPFNYDSAITVFKQQPPMLASISIKPATLVKSSKPRVSRPRPTPTPIYEAKFATPAPTNGLNHGGKLFQNFVKNLRANQYQYLPLERDEIRILRIFPDKSDDTIRCALLPATLDDDYEALSYWWGPDKLEHEILIVTQNRPAGEKFYVRPNLYAALKRLRDPENDVDLWVDALSINQEDDEEKRIQVARMEEIYSNAERVLIWLGEPQPTDDYEHAFKCIAEMCNLQRFDEHLRSTENNRKWKALADLMRNVWFSRRWVVQELALAKDAAIYAGAYNIHWDDFADAVAFFVMRFPDIKAMMNEIPRNPEDPELLPEVKKLGPNVLVDATSNLFRRLEDGIIIEHRQTLETLVSTLTAYEASDPRDTIYAVLSLARDTRRHHHHHYGSQMQIDRQNSFSAEQYHDIEADYNKDLLEVCKDFIQSCVRQSKSLDIILRHWAPVTKGFEYLTPKEVQKNITLKQKNWIIRRPLASWMPSIIHAPFGSPEQSLRGRANGDSLCGEQSNQKSYNASLGRPRICDDEDQNNVFFEAMLEDPEIARDRLANKLVHQSPLGTPPVRPFPGNINRPPVSRTVSNNEQRRVSNGTLRVRGLIIDVIKDIASACIKDTISAESLSIGGWSKDTPNFIPDELWRTMVADRGPFGSSAPRWYQRACSHAIAQRSVNDHMLTSDLVRNNQGSIMVEFLNRVSSVVWNRRFFRTRGDDQKSPADPSWSRSGKQRPGLAPSTASLNDIVCVIYGCSVPVILRPVKGSSPPAYNLIGECYLHGMMDGEALSGMRKERLRQIEVDFLLQ